MKKLLVTGAAGFIGSNFVAWMLDKYPDYHITVLDKLTYAGNLDNLKRIENNPRYRFVKGDIAAAAAVDIAIAAQGCDTIINFAAESHVDRSIHQPGDFIMTDVYGTFVLLEAARSLGVERFLQVSTDEVYGSIPAPRSSKESDMLETNSPYSASKAGGELMAHAYFATYNVPAIITRGSNNFGPYQYPEKLIPLFITNALEDKPLPVYGDGKQVRDWIYVMDHCEGIDVALHNGTPGEIYNVGGGNERYNIDITQLILKLTAKPQSLIKYVTDRPGHDRRYSLDTTKLRGLGWQPRHSFEQAMEETVRWYSDNRDWWQRIKSGEYAEFYNKQYANR
ncbi:MAG: dTDP-glucose 4,6-dehydratase [Candidatus Chloroheliales bacterium]|nr:MAG: dTDP-glucose 4,6-dehydratase [Chloroflexota bacterium]